MPPDQRRIVRLALVLLAIGALLVLVWWGDQPSRTDSAGADPSSRQSSSARPGGDGGAARTPPVKDTSGLPTVSLVDLPREARRTLELVEAGGPFPYSRDGVVFQNRERLLPRKPGGYYHEYTVPTPGEDDRGARRIVTGKAGELYYTDDHYDSFRVVKEEP